jgi:hypothetical protein
MTRYLLFVIALFISANTFSQNTNLSDYSYVIVPQLFDFSKSKDQYQLNSMTKFYFEKNGFNAYMDDVAPNVNRCDGLYANVEELNAFFGTNLQVVLKDCNNTEIYRSQEGKSKYKEFDKSYQDALRQAFKSIEALRVKQKDVNLTPITPSTVNVSKETNQNTQMEELSVPKISRVSGVLLPNVKFSSYSNSGKIFLLRKTAEGYSLYEESASAADGLLLNGKIIVMDQVVKYMDTSGKVSDASFDASGNLIIKTDSKPAVYLSLD